MMMVRFPLNVAWRMSRVMMLSGSPMVNFSLKGVNHVVVSIPCRHHRRPRGGRRRACFGQAIVQKAASVTGGCRLLYALQAFFR